MTNPIPVVVGLDIGTTLVKAQVIDAAGTDIAAFASAPIMMQIPRPGYAEQDPEEIWDRVIEVLRSVSGEIEAASGRLRGVALAAQSGSLVAMGRDERPLGNVITWMDTRADEIVARWQSEGVDREILTRSGWVVAPGLGLPIIVWISEHQPDVRSDTARFVGVDSFMAHRLTGEWVTNRSNAAGMQLMDVATGRWSPELCNLADIGESALAEIRPTGSRIGTISAEVGLATGVGTGIPLINGGHDQACGALALGVVDTSDLLVASGTAWVVTGVVDTPDPLAPGFNVSHHVVDGRWTASRFLGAFGGLMESLVDSHYPSGSGSGDDRQSRFARLDRELTTTSPSTGTTFFRLDDLPASENMGPGNVALVARMLMESAAFETELALTDLAMSTPRPSRITLVGGAASSPIWPQMIADVTRTPLDMGRRESRPAIGAALIAAVATGLRDHLQPPTLRLARVEPDPGTADHYARRLGQYQHTPPVC